MRGSRSCLVTRCQDSLSDVKLYQCPHVSSLQQRDTRESADLEAQELRSTVHIGVEDEALDDLQGRRQEGRVVEGAPPQPGPLLRQQKGAPIAVKTTTCCMTS